MSDSRRNGRVAAHAVRDLQLLTYSLHVLVRLQSYDIFFNYPNICRCFSISKSDCGKWSSEGCPHGVAQSACHIIIVAILMLKPEKSRRSLTTVLSMKIQMFLGETVSSREPYYIDERVTHKKSVESPLVLHLSIEVLGKPCTKIQ